MLSSFPSVRKFGVLGNKMIEIELPIRVCHFVEVVGEESHLQVAVRWEEWEV